MNAIFLLILNRHGDKENKDEDKDNYNNSRAFTERAK